MEFVITQEEKLFLLSLARETITAKLEKRQIDKKLEAALDKFSSENDSALFKPCGAFVTLRTLAGGNLRGCIGRMNAASPLQKTVSLMALEAAFGDPRFPPLEAGELSRISIEISALSPMTPCPDPREVKVVFTVFIYFTVGIQAFFFHRCLLSRGGTWTNTLIISALKRGFLLILMKLRGQNF